MKPKTFLPSYVESGGVVGHFIGIPFALGVQRYGVVDHIPGRLYVVTVFFHIFWFPVFPFRSELHLLVNSPANLPGVLKFPLTLRSVCLAWARALSIVGGVSSLIAIFYSSGMSGDRNAAVRIALVSMLVLVVCTFVWFILQGVGKCSTKRAKRLALLLGYSDVDAERYLQDALREEHDYERDRDRTTPCGTCGRVVSVNAAYCPRCESRLK